MPGLVVGVEDSLFVCLPNVQLAYFERRCRTGGCTFGFRCSYKYNDGSGPGKIDEVARESSSGFRGRGESALAEPAVLVHHYRLTRQDRMATGCSHPLSTLILARTYHGFHINALTQTINYCQLFLLSSHLLTFTKRPEETAQI